MEILDSLSTCSTKSLQNSFFYRKSPFIERINFSKGLRFEKDNSKFIRNKVNKKTIFLRNCYNPKILVKSLDFKITCKTANNNQISFDKDYIDFMYTIKLCDPIIKENENYWVPLAYFHKKSFLFETYFVQITCNLDILEKSYYEIPERCILCGSIYYIYFYLKDLELHSNHTVIQHFNDRLSALYFKDSDYDKIESILIGYKLPDGPFKKVIYFEELFSEYELLFTNVVYHWKINFKENYKGTVIIKQIYTDIFFECLPIGCNQDFY